jgi:peptidoglycan/LPS O-acetylase OafA/YrhL
MNSPNSHSQLSAKIFIGIIVGAALGLLDGLSSYLTPAARPLFLFIVLASTLKGFVTGVLTALIASRTRKLWPAILTGLGIGLVLSFLAATFTPDPQGHRYYFQIILPGAVLGAVVGFATHKARVARRHSND